MDQTNSIYGKNPVLEAIDQGIPLAKVFLQKGVSGPFEKTIRQHCKKQQVPLSVVPPDKLRRLTKGSHQGVVAWVSPISFWDVHDLIAQVYEQESRPLLIFLEGITDPRNVGAIARSGWALGAHGLIVTAKRSAPIHEVAVKASAGALLHIPVSRVPSVAALQILRDSGFRLVATDLQGSSSMASVDLDGPVVIVMGSEGDGISMETRQLVDHLYRIPQVRSFDSLNVSVAAGIVLFEINRYRSNLLA